MVNAAGFLLGPVLVTSLGAAGDSTLASIIAAVLILGGGGALAAQGRTAPPPAPPPTRGQAERTRAGRPLLQPAFVLLALLNLAIGLYFGVMTISVSAFAVSRGVPGAAALIIAAAGLSGLLSGWLYGRRRHTAPPRRQLVIATAYLMCSALLLPLAPSVVWLAAAVVVTEAAVPRTLALLNVLTEKAVPPAVLTQAFTWSNSASAAGSALAASLAGRAADAWGPSAALALAPAAGLVLLVLSLAALRSGRETCLPVLTRPLGRPAGRGRRTGRTAGGSRARCGARRAASTAGRPPTRRAPRRSRPGRPAARPRPRAVWTRPG
jgi:predicted MFS family arabinose efflux permease